MKCVQSVFSNNIKPEPSNSLFHYSKTLAWHLRLLQTLDEDPVSPGKDYQWQNRPVSEWTNQQVCHWLMGMNMDQYTAEFTAKGVDGLQLLHLDSDKLKVKNSELLLLNITLWCFQAVLSMLGLWLDHDIIWTLTATLWPDICMCAVSVFPCLDQK